MKTLEWRDCRPVRKMTLLIATGFGLGLSPFASGTFGSLLGVLIVLGSRSLPLTSGICLAVLLPLLAIPVCGIAEKHFGKKDDGRIVADEYMTFPLCVLGLPWQGAPILLAIAFVTHRFFDVIKPFPARRFQDNLEGGKGVVLDDVVSSLYSLAANHAIWWALSTLGRKVGDVF